MKTIHSFMGMALCSFPVMAQQSPNFLIIQCDHLTIIRKTKNPLFQNEPFLGETFDLKTKEDFFATRTQIKTAFEHLKNIVQTLFF